MTQQSPKQKDVDASPKNEQAYGTGPGKVEIPRFKTPDASHTEPRANPKTIAAQPKVGQTTRNGSAPAKEARPVYENGLVDAPAGNDPTESRADAKRDESPNQKPTLLNADQARDE